jgi:hypothetical protein
VSSSAWTRVHPRGRTWVRANGLSSARTHGYVRADASNLPPGKFKKDATVRQSHGRPRGHRMTVRPSVIVRVTTLDPTVWLLYVQLCTWWNIIQKKKGLHQLILGYY